jgi:hypothetical protein
MHSDPERKELTDLINAWAEQTRAHHAAVRAQLYKSFGVRTFDELTVDRVKEVCAYVRGMIDRTQPAALPPAREQKPVSLSLADVDRLHIDMRNHMQKALDCGSLISNGLDEQAKAMKYTEKHNVMCYLSYSFNDFANAWEAIAEAMKNNAKAMAYLRIM